MNGCRRKARRPVPRSSSPCLEPHNRVEGNDMRRLRKLALATLVWLTVATTLLAGMPYTTCHCAADSPSTASADPVRGRTCCGCAGACCGTKPAASSRIKQSASKSSCCSVAKPRGQIRSNPQPQIHCVGCTRTLTQTLPSTVAPGKHQLESKQTAYPLLSLHLPRKCLMHSLVGHPAWHDSAGCSPPADLLITLQHLLI
jgi:hypothetical protein